jgi:hypothetical protein
VAERNVLYRELRPVMETLTNPVFEFSETCVRKRNGFLPHGAVLTPEGEVVLVAAATELAPDAMAASEDVLPLLHVALREAALSREAVAVALSEDVTIRRGFGLPTRAIKVLFEHRRGLVVALYEPIRRRLLRGYAFGKMIAKDAVPEIKAWSDS